MLSTSNGIGRSILWIEVFRREAETTKSGLEDESSFFCIQAGELSIFLGPAEWGGLDDGGAIGFESAGGAGGSPGWVIPEGGPGWVAPCAD